MSTEELSGDAPDGGEGVSGASWEAWEKAGIDPNELNPYEVRQYVDWVSELTAADSHEATLEQALRRWGHLGDDESLSELMSLRDQIRAERDDPFAGYVDQQYYEDDSQYEDYTNYGADSGGVDPYQLRDVWRADMQQELAREREQMQQQLQTERLVSDLQGQLDRVSNDNGLEESEKAFLWESAISRLQNQQVALDEIPQLMNSTWNQIESMYQKRMARAATSTNSGPMTSAPPSGVPGDAPPGRGIQSALARTAERLGIPNE